MYIIVKLETLLIVTVRHRHLHVCVIWQVHSAMKTSPIWICFGGWNLSTALSDSRWGRRDLRTNVHRWLQFVDGSFAPYARWGRSGSAMPDRSIRKEDCDPARLDGWGILWSLCFGLFGKSVCILVLDRNNPRVITSGRRFISSILYSVCFIIELQLQNRWSLV